MARKLEVVISGDTSSLSRAFSKAASDSSSFGSKVSHGLGTVAKFAGLAAVAVGGGLVLGMKKAIDSANAHAVALAQTQAALKSTGGAAKVSAKEITSLADTMEKKTGIDDLAIQTGSNLLLTFTKIRNEVGKGNDIFNQATKVAVDLSVALGKDIPGSAMMLGKALNDPIKGMTALGRAGVQFTADQKEAIKAMVETGNVLGAQKLILEEVTRQVGGSAEAFGKTLPGQLNILKGHLDDVAQRIGEKLVPALTKAVEWVTGHWPQISRVMETVAGGVEAAIGAAVGQIRTHWESIKQGAMLAVAGIKTAFELAIGPVRAFGNFIRSDLGQQMAAGALATLGLYKALTMIRAGVAVAQLALASLRANPFFLALIPLGLLVGTFAQKFVEGKFKVDQFKAAVDGLKSAMDGLVGSMDRLRGAELSVTEAGLNLQRSQINAKVSTDAWNAAVKESGRGSLEAKTAYLTMRESLVAVERATLELKNRTAEHTEAEKKRKSELSASGTALEKVRQEAEKSQGPIRDYIVGLDLTNNALVKVTRASNPEAFFAFRDSMLAASLGASKLSVELTKTGDTAGAKTQADISKLARTIFNLTFELNRVPTKKEIELALKRTGGADILKDLQRVMAGMKSAADKGGKDAGAGAQAGVKAGTKPIPADMRAIIAQGVSNIRGQTGQAHSAGFSVGAAAKAGAMSGAAGLGQQLGAQFARDIRTAVAWARANTGSTTEAYTARMLGVPAAQGLIAGFKAHLAADTEMTAAVRQATAVRMAASVLPAIQAAGQVLGMAKAKAIAMGFLQGAPTITQQIKQALKAAAAAELAAVKEKAKELQAAMAEKWKAAMQAATQAVADSRGALVSAFSGVASAALAAFDKKVGEWVSPAQQMLDKLNFDEQVKQIKDDLLKGATGFSAALVSLDEAILGGDPEKIQAAQDAMLAAQDVFNKAALADTKFALQQKAVEEALAHTKLVEQQRSQFETQLAQLQTALALHPEEHAKIQEKIIALLKKYVPDFELRGTAIGFALAAGLRAGIKEVESAADALAEAIGKRIEAAGKRMRGSGPWQFTRHAVGEPMAKGVVEGFSREMRRHRFDQPFLTAPQGAGQFQGSPALAAGPPARPLSRMGLAGAGGGVVVNVAGSVVTERDLVDTIRRELYRIKSRNVTSGL